MSLDALRTVQAFTDASSVRDLQAGATLFREGDPGERLYGLLEGVIELREARGSAAERITAGHVFGAAALVTGGHRRQATAVALEPCRLLELDRETFLFAVQETPMFALALIAGLEERLEQVKGGGA
ncbi:cyclic nucleotide-binding domain-containing protein [Synechococcus sp. GreenBA-s]|jgi:CRP-like cAMP-binding protein|nr:cyclic nucleotide-binding domain-containing protein [Synechococcus sp. GreenBA-s]